MFHKCKTVAKVKTKLYNRAKVEKSCEIFQMSRIVPKVKKYCKNQRMFQNVARGEKCIQTFKKKLNKMFITIICKQYWNGMFVYVCLTSRKVVKNVMKLRKGGKMYMRNVYKQCM